MSQNHVETVGSPTVCSRCKTELTRKNAYFYNISIEAIADPTPVYDPQLTAEQITAELDKVFRQLSDVSESEAMDHVHKHMKIRLCVRCYIIWIKNPVAG